MHVAGLAASGDEFLVHAGHPAADALTAGGALAAAFVAVEAHEVPGGVHDAVRLRDQGHAAGAEHAAGGGNRLVIHGRVENGVGPGQHGAAAPAGNDGLHLLQGAARPVVDEFAEGGAQRQFVHAGPRDWPRHLEEFHALALLGAHARVPVRAVAQDLRGGAEGLDVVDGGGQPVQARRRREGRFEARVGAQALQRVHERGFLAADVRPGAPVHVQLEVEAAAQDVLPQQSGRAGLVNGGPDALGGVHVLTPDVDVPHRGAHGVRGDDHALDQLVRVLGEQVAVLEGAGLGFVRVADDVVRFAVLQGHERPLQARREARAAAPAQAGFLHLVDHGVRAHRKGAPHGFVPAVLAVVRECPAVRLPDVRVERRREARVFRAGDRLRGRGGGGGHASPPACPGRRCRPVTLDPTACPFASTCRPSAPTVTGTGLSGSGCRSFRSDSRIRTHLPGPTFS